MKFIQLTQGQVAVVDDEDFERFGHLKFFAHLENNKRNFYAYRSIRLPNGRKTIRSLHREIMGVTDPKVKVDHRNHDTLNCQRRNLRACSNSQNGMNRKGHQANSKSGVRGVNFDKSKNKWRARIKVNGKRICLGRFVDKSAAASAYAEANRKYFGEFGGHL